MLLRSAGKLFQDVGYVQASIYRITSAVNAPKGTFYNYFRSKEDLASRLVDRQFEALREGLGRAIVEASLAAGNKVMATARNTESLNDLSDRYGNQVKLFALDVTDESAATAAVKTAIDTFGLLDVVVNNAGYGNLSSVEDTPMSDFRAQIETNLFGTIIVTKADRENYP